MESVGGTSLMVTDMTNIRYLTGFTGSSAVLLLSLKDALIISDGRYEQQLQQQCPQIESVIRSMDETLIESTVKKLKVFCPDEVYFEYGAISLQQFDAVKKSYRGTLKRSGGWVEKLRAVKDEIEIDLIRKSISINETVFQSVVQNLSPEITESAIAAEIEYQGRRLGAEGCSFEPIVAVGVNSALAHYRPGNIAIGESEFVLIDWGVNFRGYASDLTRMVVTSKIPARLAEIYQVAIAAQRAAIEKIKPGVAASSVDAAAREIIFAAGFGDQFTHSLGHGIGLNIHESPRLSPGSEDALVAGMVVTVEPGIYLPGFGGVRIEDDVLITTDGHEVLSNLPKELEQCIVQV